MSRGMDRRSGRSAVTVPVAMCKLTGSSECGPGNEMTYVQLSDLKDRRSSRLRPTREQDVDLPVSAASAVYMERGAAVAGGSEIAGERPRRAAFGPQIPPSGEAKLPPDFGPKVQLEDRTR